MNKDKKDKKNKKKKPIIQNGKGDRNRVSNPSAYRDGYDRINWRKK